jgi:glycosyltransferase involved in cell wall biosynthesis
MPNTEPAARPPHISVILPTRNRPADAARCLASLARVRYPAWNLLVIDQSDDDATEAVVQGFAVALPHLAYVRTAARGLSHARNIGLSHPGGPIIAFIDDDCTVGTDWLERVADRFKQFPGAALCFGALAPAPEHDGLHAFVPTFSVRRERFSRRFLGASAAGGVGASMYLRRDSVALIGEFDRQLGAGVRPFAAAEDADYLHRALLAGLAVVHTPTITVIHHGSRDHASGASSRVKLLRCGDMIVALLIARECLRALAAIDILGALFRRRPSNGGRLISYIRGLRASFQFDLDRERRLYRRRGSNA